MKNDIVLQYIEALKNEIAVDLHIYSTLGARAEEYGHLPRPAKWFGRGKNHVRIVSLTSYVVRILWVFVFCYVYFFLEFLKLTLSIKKTRFDVRQYQGREIALAFSSRAVEIIRLQNIGREPQAWIVFPWVGSAAWKENDHKADVTELTNYTHLVKALWYCLRTIWFVLQDPALSKWVLQTYTAYKWFIVYMALEKIDAKKFIIAEHYDRWAVLADALTFGRKTHGTTLVIIQHGVVKDLKVNQAELGFTLPYRLRAAKEIFVFDEESKQIFRKSILSAEHNRDIEFHYYKVKICLTPLTDKVAKSILIVGHSLCIAFHEAMILHISEKRKDIRIYYKPHPLSKAIPNVSGYALVEAAGCFPQVNILLSYPSTLVQEYSDVGISSVVHPLNEESGSVRDYFAKISDKLEGIENPNSNGRREA